MNELDSKQEQELIKKGRSAYRKYRLKDPAKAAKQAEYIRNWKKRHPEKQAEYMKRFWLKQAEQNKHNESE